MRKGRILLASAQALLIVMALVSLLFLLIYFFKNDVREQAYNYMHNACSTILKLNETAGRDYFVNYNEDMYLINFDHIDKFYTISKFRDDADIKNELDEIIKSKSDNGLSIINSSYGRLLLSYKKDSARIAIMLSNESQLFQEIDNIQRKCIYLIVTAFFVFLIINYRFLKC